MSEPPVQSSEGNGARQIDAIITRSEGARERFDEELDGLIEDLRQVREVIRKEERERHDADTGEGRGTV